MQHFKYFFLLIIGLLLLPLSNYAQSPSAPAMPAPPQSFDNFLDEDDFDTPPGTPVTPRNSMKQTAPSLQPIQPNFPNLNSGNSSADMGNTLTPGGSKPTIRKNRKSPPNLMSSKKDSLAEATDKDITDANYPDLIDSFDYPNAEISDIVKAISELTGKNFIMEPSVKGKITIIAPSRITVAEAYKAFLSALAINGYTLVPAGKFLKVKQAQNAVRDNLDTYSGGYSPNTDNMITRIIQLHYIQAKDIVNNLGPILQSRLGEMRPYEPTNTLIISDYGSNIERIMKILRQLDVPGFEEQLEVIRVKYAKASDLAKTVDQIINKGKSNPSQGGGFATGIPRFNPIGGSAGGQGSDAYSLVIPDERTNTMIVVGNTQGIEKIRKLVRKLDFRIRPEDAGGVYVYYVRFGDSEKIAQTLSSLAQNSAASSAAPSPFGIQSAPQKLNIFSGDVKVVADKTTNSIVITASKQDYDVVESILKRLDIARNQVYIEGIIMEINVQNLKQWGINYYNFVADSVAGRSGFSNGLGQSKSFFDIGGDNGGILSFGGGSKVSITPPTGGSAVQIPSLVGFINFLSSVTNTNILSTPQIMALDNEEAEIEVGSTVPVGSSTVSTSSGTTTSQTREDATIKLNIKPHISPGSDAMRLEILQTFRGIGNEKVNAKNLDDNAISITKRNAKTNVIVRDKDTIVLGGLMKDEEKVIITKVPLLGDIPILGWLFKGKQTQKTKMNLMMFLTPKIIRNSQVSAELVKDKMKERLNFIERDAGGKDIQGDLVDQLKLEKNGVPESLK